MKLNPEIKSNLKLLDYEYGGGIETELTKVDMIDKPVLIVGLGGTGIESLIRVKKSINRYFKNQTLPDGRKSDKPSGIEYLAIDSDDSMQNLNYKGISFSKENNEFVLLESANLTAIYKNRDSVFKELTKDWISDNLRLQQVKHGAGGIRQAGRFLLFINMSSVINAITSKINKLVVNRKANDLIYVFILTGVSGGTGSGIFIDVPYIIRRIAEQRGFETENIGMVFMPDVTLSDNAIDGAAALNIKSNGFAGLKELDYVMNIERSGEIFEQNYSDIEVKTNQPPYDLCHLISAKDEEGKTVSSPKDYCMNVAAETVINFIASEEVLDGQSYTVSSYMSNIENNRSTFITTHAQKHPTNYMYNIVGASGAVLPIDYLTNYLTGRMFGVLDELKTNTPSADDVMQAMQGLGIDLFSIENEIELQKPPVRDITYDYSILKQKPDIVEDVLKNALVRYRDYLKQKADELIHKFEETINDGNNLIIQHFVDFDRGPFYACKEISPTYEISILKEIDEIRKKEITKKRVSADVIIGLDAKMQAAKKRLTSGVGLLKKSIADGVIQTSKAYYTALMRNENVTAIDKIYESYYEMLYKYQHKVIDTYCEMLVSLQEIFHKVVKPSTNNAEDNFVWDIASPREFCDAVESNETLLSLVDNKAVLKKYFTELITNAEVLLNAKKTDVAVHLSQFITREMSGVIEKSMDFYFELLAEKDGISADRYIGLKMNQLRDSAKVMFPMTHIPSGLNIEFPPYSYIAVPFNAPQIRNKVKSEAGFSGCSHIKLSKMVNRLYMLNLKIAVALYCYRELNDYEQVYETALGKIAGLHLYEGKQKNWRGLPSPNYDKLWVAGYENKRELEKNNTIREVFHKAVQYGYIQLNTAETKYVCRYGDTIDIFKEFGFAKEDVLNKTIPSSAARILIAKLNGFLSDSSRLKYEKSIYDIEFLSDQKTPDDDYAKGIFIYMPELNVRMAEQVATHEQILEVLKLLSSLEQVEVKHSDFAQLLYMRKIYQKRKTFRYQIDGVEHVLYTLDNLQEKYSEYELFQAFLELSPQDAAWLREKAVQEENNYSDDDFQEIIQIVQHMSEDFESKQKALQTSYLMEREGSQKLTFYTTMLDVMNKTKQLISVS